MVILLCVRWGLLAPIPPVVLRCMAVVEENWQGTTILADLTAPGARIGVHVQDWFVQRAQSTVSRTHGLVNRFFLNL